MFVLPPPPTYSINKLYPNGVPGGLLETNNILRRKEGPDYQLVLGEGTYVLRDELALAQPPPHPSDVQVPNTNPLATTVSLPTKGTRITLTSIAPRARPEHGLYRLPTASMSRSLQPPSTSEEARHSLTSDESNPKSNGTELGSAKPPFVFGGDNPALVIANGEKGKDANKKKKPKNNIVKSNSTFVSRVIPLETLQKRLGERSIDGLFAFANINRAMHWLDLSGEPKTDNFTKILFTKAHVLSHDVNEMTKGTHNLDVLFGHNTSDIIWYEPTSQKYTRINKNGVINTSAVSSIYWIPQSENLFIAAHMDGSLIVYDRDKEDAPFITEELMPVESEVPRRSTSRMTIRKSVQSRNQKTNPVAYWKLGVSQINNIAFSPDGKHLAVACEDGTLKIIDFFKETLLDVYRSYYGGFLCVTWSPDGRYILTGGQDDLVSIWSFADSALVARCQGHSSWVTDVKFDPWRCDERNYRFGSVGEDCKLLLWDFSVGMLGRPKTFSIRQRASMSSAVPGRNGSEATEMSPKAAEDGTGVEPVDSTGVVHKVEPKANVPMLPPVMAKKVHDNPCSWLGFEDDCIITADVEGRIRTWDRPKDGAA